MTTFTVADFYPGQRCEITKAHHRWDEKELGKKVIVVKVNTDTGMIWTHDDEPAKYRTNRNGRQVTVYNPKNIHSPRPVDTLTPLPDEISNE
jgi:hypothetical protein